MTELINSVWIIVCNPCSASEYINLIPLLGPLSRWCGNASSYAGASSHNTRINLQNGRKVPTTFAPRPSDFVFHVFISKGWVQFTFMYIENTLVGGEVDIFFFFSGILLLVCPKNAARALFDLCEGYFLWHGVLRRRIWRGQSIEERHATPANSIIFKMSSFCRMFQNYFLT